MKRILALTLIILLALAVPGWASSTDDFNRATIGANWTNVVGGIITASSLYYAGSSSQVNAAIYNAASFQAGQYSQILYIGDINVGPLVRGADGRTTFYSLNVASTSQVVIQYIDGNTGTALNTIDFSPVITSGQDVIRLEVTGDSPGNVTLTFKISYNGGDWVTKGTATHSANQIYTGSPGVYCYDTTQKGDNWTGGNLVDVVAPTVTTQAVSSIAKTTATGNGTITDDGGGTISENGVAVGTSANPTIAGTHFNPSPGDVSGAFTAAMTGLTENTLYHARAFATNEAGTSYGSDVTFTTSRDPATLYMRADGTAATIAAATGPTTTVANCMNVTVHNAGPLVPGDTIYISDKGGTYSAANPDISIFVPPNSGTSADPIVYAKASGESPIIDASFDIGTSSGWSLVGSGVYRKAYSYAFQPRAMWEDNTTALKWAGAVNGTACDGPGSWFYSGGYLYYYPSASPGPTPGDHTSLNIIQMDGQYGQGGATLAFDLRERSYIDISGLTINRGTIVVASNLGSPGAADLAGIKIHDNTFNYSHWGVMGEMQPGGRVFKDSEFYNNTLNYCNAGLSVWVNIYTSHIAGVNNVKIYDNTFNHHFSIDASNSWKWGMDYTNSPDHEAISFQDSESCEVTGNTITCDLPLIGVVRAIFLYVDSNVQSMNNNIIAFNKITGAYDRAINFSEEATEVGGTKIYCNTLKNTGTTTVPGEELIYIKIPSNTSTADNYICNNTIYSTSNKSQGLNLYSSSGKWTVKNNIVTTQSRAVTAEAATKADYTFSNNSYWGNGKATFYDPDLVSWDDWKALGWDASGSINNADPALRASDLALTASSPASVKTGGTPVEGVTVVSGTGQLGIDGKTFSVAAPAMGAYAGTVFSGGGGASLGLGLSGGNYRPRR